ncbi:hypothetical protein TNCV_1383721 [Trichonephila clavipes]|nr:hypothetical protein TNCV_1383721 [Trichonephila clavipes]
MTFSNICGRISAITRRMLSSNGQAFVAYPHRPMTLHSPTENSLAVLNHKILEANSQLLDIMIVQFRNEKLVIMALYRSPLTVSLWPSSFLKKLGPMIPPAHKAHQTVSFSGCNSVSTYTCGLASLNMRQFCLLT